MKQNKKTFKNDIEKAERQILIASVSVGYAIIGAVFLVLIRSIL